MNSKTYLAYRIGLRKRANGFGFITEPIKEVGKGISEGAKDSWGLALPLGGILLAYLAYKATTPKAVADNASAYAANALERESLAESVRDLEDMKQAARFKNSKKRYHDQFI